MHTEICESQTINEAEIMSGLHNWIMQIDHNFDFNADLMKEIEWAS